MTAMLRFIRFETFTGWHMLFVMVLFFGTIISVNVTMAVFAGKSWSGLIVENTYVASQQFDEDVALNKAMAARGWTSDLALEEDRITYRLNAADGTAVAGDRATLHLHRPVGVRGERMLSLAYQGDGRYTAAETVSPGQWVARVSVMRGDDLVYREATRLWVDGRESGE